MGCVFNNHRYVLKMSYFRLPILADSVPFSAFVNDSAMSRITIKDIARLLSLNASTVSRALSNHPNVNPETRQKVFEVAQEMGYIPNSLAVNLRRKHSGLIALILADMNMFFLPSVIRAVEEQVRQAGYHLIILQSNNDLSVETQNLHICRQMSVEGILISLSWQTRDLRHFAALFEDKIPIVFFDKTPPEDGYNTVAIDNRQAAYRAAHYLLEKGYRHFIGLLGKPSLSMTQERLAGYQQALGEFGLPVDESRLIFAENSQSAKEQVFPLLKKTGQKAALFAMSDEVMVGAVQAAGRAGCRIPEDLAVVCISDGFAPEFYNPPITHLFHSGYEVGLTASKLLFQLILGEQQTPMRIQVHCPLVELGSV